MAAFERHLNLELARTINHMRPGLRPKVIRQIFAPVPAARSRCLSTFIAISRQGLPAPLRYEPSHVLLAAGVLALTFGLAIESYIRLGSTLILCGWGLCALAFIALICQDKLIYGYGRPRLLRMLDESRRTVGLDEALLPESLEFLETTAQQWERIEHALEAHVWIPYADKKYRIYLAAHKAMEDIVVWECGTTEESGLTDSEADRLMSATANNLRLLADAVDSAGSALQTYPREFFESNGEDPVGVVDEVKGLEDAIERLNFERMIFSVKEDGFEDGFEE